tara:strand:- start:3107 stop:3289 length:183 start_codon:yes stop_codon:yes gene_type:complete
MEEVTIYKFQLIAMIEALRVTSNIHDCHEKKTCHDRMVTRAKKYGENAIEGKKDELVKYA